MRARIVLTALLSLCAGSAAAAPARDRHDPTPPPLEENESRSVLSVLPRPGPDLDKARNELKDRGVYFAAKYIGEVFGSTTGGQRRGTIYEGRVRYSLDVDFATLAGIDGLAFHTTGFQLHGKGIDAYYVGSLNPPSNIEATPANRLYELWLQQSLIADKVNVRFGQLGSDQEFMYPEWGQMFINGAFGWPTITASNLPGGGGPAYPLSSLGVRLRLTPVENVSFLVSVLDGDPSGPQGPLDSPDPQRRNPDGLQFRLKDHPFLIGEGQFRYKIDGLDGSVKLGGWRHYGNFADLHYSSDWLSLADPNSNGLTLQRRGDHGLYAILDQKIGDGAGPGRGAGFFARASVAPGDRNLVSAYADAGVSFVGVMKARPDDLFGLAVGYARVSDAARSFDRDTAFFNGVPTPVRSSEALVEATYIAKLAPGWSIQPDIQYIRRPGGNIADPRDPNGIAPARNSLVLGLRTLLRF